MRFSDQSKQMFNDIANPLKQTCMPSEKSSFIVNALKWIGLLSFILPLIGVIWIFFTLVGIVFDFFLDHDTAQHSVLRSIAQFFVGMAILSEPSRLYVYDWSEYLLGSTGDWIYYLYVALGLILSLTVFKHIIGFLGFLKSSSLGLVLYACLFIGGIYVGLSTVSGFFDMPAVKQQLIEQREQSIMDEQLQDEYASSAETRSVDSESTRILLNTSSDKRAQISAEEIDQAPAKKTDSFLVR